MSVFAIIIACSLPAETCQSLEDTTGPHATQDACNARLLEMRQAAVMLTLSTGPGPYRVVALCEPLDVIRRVAPNAFEGHAEGFEI